jgi:hypothetical protein
MCDLSIVGHIQEWLIMQSQEPDLNAYVEFPPTDTRLRIGMRTTTTLLDPHHALIQTWPRTIITSYSHHPTTHKKKITMFLTIYHAWRCRICGNANTSEFEFQISLNGH